MTNEPRTTGRSMHVGSASFALSWRRCAARSGVLVLFGLVALAGCAGVPGVAPPPASPASKPSPAEPPAAPGGVVRPVTVASNPASGIRAGVFPTKTPIHVGEKMNFLLSANTVGYGSLYLHNASGTVWALAENLQIRTDGPTLFPTPRSGIILRASPPAGVHRVVLLVTRQPFAGLGGVAGGISRPVQLAMGWSEFLASLNATVARLPKDSWDAAEARFDLRVGEAGRPSDG